jgi:hypothetical protein
MGMNQPGVEGEQNIGFRKSDLPLAQGDTYTERMEHHSPCAWHTSQLETRMTDLLVGWGGMSFLVGKKV